VSAFADASAVVKRYADEPGSELVQGDGELVVSDLTRVEAASALWRKHRLGELGAGRASAAVDALADDCESVFAVVALGPLVLDEAMRVVGRHPLRAGDAIQLASAVLARRADPECDTLICFDGRLRDAAAVEGFALLP